MQIPKRTARNSKSDDGRESAAGGGAGRSVAWPPKTPDGGSVGGAAAVAGGDIVRRLGLLHWRMPTTRPLQTSMMGETKRGDRVRGPVGNTL